jgi:hypothetical protein
MGLISSFSLLSLGQSSALLVAAASPRCVIEFVQGIQNKTRISRVFIGTLIYGMFELVATNSGDQVELAHVMNSLEGISFPREAFWFDAQRHSVLEQIIASRSAVFVVPPGASYRRCAHSVASSIEHTSSFSTFVIEKRTGMGLGGDSTVMCCGFQPGMLCVVKLFKAVEALQPAFVSPQDGTFFRYNEEIVVRLGCMFITKGVCENRLL